MNRYINHGDQHGSVPFCSNDLLGMSSGPCIVLLALSLLGMVHWGSALSPSMSDLVVGRGGGAGGGAGRREPASGESGTMRDYQERERLKEEVAKELAEMVLTVIYDNPGGQSATIGRHPYMNQGLEYSVLNDMELLGNADLANSRLYSKKSFDDNERMKRIRFHQCYFNPISCFR